MASCASSRAGFGLKLLPVEGVVLVVAPQVDSSFERVRVSAQDMEAVSAENVVSGSGTFVEEREDEMMAWEEGYVRYPLVPTREQQHKRSQG